MIPLKDDVRSVRVPIINYIFIILNVLVFIYEVMLGNRLGDFIRYYGFIPQNVFYNFFNTHTILTLFTSMFIHANLLHILGNMLFLWVFGDNIEDAFGHPGFILFYIISGLAGSFLHTVFSPNSSIPSVGASGAISGVMGAYVVLYPRARILALIPFGFFIRLTYLPALLFLGFWFLLQLFYGFVLRGANGGVAYFAHIGGFVAGLLMAILLKKLKRSSRYVVR